MLSGVSSPHRLVESVRVAYGFRGLEVDTFIVVKSTGLASQVGVPEAYRVALRYGKPLVVLPSLREVLELFRFDEVYVVLPGRDDLRGLDELELGDRRYALVFSGEEHGRSELPAEALSVPELPADSPPQAVIALALYKVLRRRAAAGAGSGG